MLKKFWAVAALLSVLLLGGVAAPAEAMTTLEKYKGSTICVIVMKDKVTVFSEPVNTSLTVRVVTKGTELVPCNQQTGVDKANYFLVVLPDGAIGWVDSANVTIGPKKR